MPTDLKKAAEWALFGLGLLVGAALAFIIYAGLQPRLEKTVRAQQALKDEARKKDSLATAVTTAKAKVTLKALQKQPQAPATKPATQPPPVAAPSTTSPVRFTTLVPTGAATYSSLRKPGLAVGLALAVMAAALLAGAAAWRQLRQEPQPPGAITSPVLEALFTLNTHRRMLQQELALSPRQIKRFSSKARVQHSQLRALLKPLNGTSPNLFSVDNQLKAFQMLLLLEEKRRQQQLPPADNAVEFIRQLQAAYLDHTALAQAREEASLHPIIVRAKSREASAAASTPAAEARFMQQLYEMNAGLLA